MKKTKVVDVFNRTSRKIKCIVKEMDYLGDASIWKEEKLVVGELYTEEEVIALIHKFNYDLVNSNIETFKEWFDEHKKQIT